jgi:beta-lactamase class A
MDACVYTIEMILRWWKPAVLGAACLLVGTGAGWFAHQVSPLLYKGGVQYQSNAPFTYIDPLLACDIGSQEAFPEFAPLKSQLTSLVNKKIAAGDAQKISIYARSLRSARWFEINPSNTYAPASLLKVFVMMAYFKEADDADSPSLLQKRLLLEATATSSQEDPGEAIPHLTTGASYTIEELILQMIKYSDNDALNTLVDNFDPNTLSAFQAIFADLNIPSPVAQSEGSFNFMTVDNYALVFRVLFGSTYLSDRYSEQALGLLAQAHYKAGLAAGVPATLQVAHKFGVTTLPATAATPSTNELHDCGIVYYPNNHPYLLCVMTEGNDFAKLQQTLKDVSAVSYAWLSNYYNHLPGATTSTAVRP